VASIYDFESVGTGDFTFTPLTDFQVQASADLVSASSDAAVAKAVTVTVTSDVAKRHASPSLSKRATVSCSSSSQASFISSRLVNLFVWILFLLTAKYSYSEAKTLASGASSYITGTGGSLFTSYYGTNSKTTVAGKFNAVASESSGSRT